MAFSFKTVGHYLATAFSVYKGALKLIDSVGTKAQSFEPLAEGLALAGGPEVVAIERASEAALGIVLSLVHQMESANADVSKAASDKLTNLSSDQTVIADFKALYQSSKADLAKLGFKL